MVESSQSKNYKRNAYILDSLRFIFLGKRTCLTNPSFTKSHAAGKLDRLKKLEGDLKAGVETRLNEPKSTSLDFRQNSLQRTSLSKKGTVPHRWRSFTEEVRALDGFENYLGDLNIVIRQIIRICRAGKIISTPVFNMKSGMDLEVRPNNLHQANYRV